MINPYRLTKTYEDYDSAALFDFDFNEVEFRRKVELCERLNKNQKPTRRKNGRYVYHAYSNVNFDLWLVLHKEEHNRAVTRNDAYINDVRRLYGLKSNDDIKAKRTINKILEQIELDDVKAAIERADKIRREKLVTDAVKIGLSKTYHNPDFSIHKFLKSVLRDSGDL